MSGRFLRRLGPWLALAFAAGCGGDPSTRSPLASSDPDRHARATRETDEIARQNQESEARFYAALGVARPGQGQGHDPEGPALLSRSAEVNPAHRVP